MDASLHPLYLAKDNLSLK
jgi:hypothetical protein